MMKEPIIPIGWTQLSLTSILILLVVALSLVENLRQERDYLIGVLRTFTQLFLVGYVLDVLFSVNRWYLVLLLLALMIGAACQAGVGRLKQRDFRLYGMMALSLGLGAGVTIVVVTTIILRIHPWYNPRYLIPLAGMIIGNAMNGASLSAERYRGELILREKEMETLLSLGFGVSRASSAARRCAIHAAMLPTLNSMMVVGLVSLPGMMTGQILAGASPMIAVRYQIVVMIMISSAVMLSALLMVKLLSKRFFTSAHQIRYDLLRN